MSIETAGMCLLWYIFNSHYMLIMYSSMHHFFFITNRYVFLCTKFNQCAPWLELLKHTPNCFFHNLIVCNLMQRYEKKMYPVSIFSLLKRSLFRSARARDTEDNTDRNRTGIMYLFHCFCYPYLLEKFHVFPFL